jgi:hypothetical protein
MRRYSYNSELIDLLKAEKVIRRALDTYCNNRKQRNYLFEQLQIVEARKNNIYFKIKVNERIRKK